MKKFILFTLLVVSLVITSVGFAEPTVFVGSDSSNVQQLGDDGAIDWQNGYIQAIGKGVVNPNALTPQQGQIGAERAAKIDALRNLGEAVKGLKVDSSSTIENQMQTSDVIKTQTSFVIKGASVLKTSFDNGIATVVVQLKSSKLNAVINQQALTEPRQELPQPINTKALDTVKPVVAGTPFTGLVIDASGLDVSRCFSPGVYDETGRNIYGNKIVDPDWVIKYGMVDYASTDEYKQEIVTGKSRAGVNPLTIKAIALRDNNSNFVISKDDADKIIIANGGTKFIQQCAVVVKY